jgi:hypothetical protein
VVRGGRPLRGLPRTLGQHRAGPGADDENARLAEAAWALYALGADTVVVEDLLASGSGSRVWRLVGYGADGTRTYAVKWFRPRHRQAGRAVATQYAALTRLAGVLAGLPTEAFALRCPAPVQVWDWGYAMTAVPGTRLDRAIAARLLPAADLAPLARDLVTALRAFHTADGGPYGDFEPSNVLLAGPREVYLLDPGPANGDPPQPAGPALAADVACWIGATAIGALTLGVRHPRSTAGCVQLAGELTRAAVAGSGDPRLAGDIDCCLAQQWSRLRRRGPHYRALAAIAGRRLRRASSGDRVQVRA